MSDKPILRPLDFQPVTHLGQQMWLLRDPLQLSPQQLIVPQGLAQMLMLLDGRRTRRQIHEDFCRMVGEILEFEIVDNALDQLDAAFLLDNGRSRQARQALLAEYRAQPHRPPALADLSYPGDPAELTKLFQTYADGDDLDGWQPWHGRAVISPHIDYQRGGPVYAKVWRRAETAVLEADLVLIFGTDHNGGLGTMTLTHQPYATPYGVLPTDLTLIDELAAAIGPENAFGEELHHRAEHSVELSAVWLHHVYHQAGMAPKPMVPILCGSFHHFVTNGGYPEQDNLLNTAVATLRRVTAGKKVLAVASVDLAHVGPNFGDDFLMDAPRRTRLRKEDDRLIQTVLQGDAAGFYTQIAAIQDRNRICGFSSIHTMLRFLGPVNGRQVAYEHCPADPQDTSLVSICGLLLE
ncbi:MAG: AmmeMemoRadiSam system protein B [Ardenticatenaceae bacterium]|nr:AmmeMemoRadiSam system protein B [Ardenticatenaceae bacterium]MCB9446445.1 AmmeMemoRadiSam system protein B [Ardenticatenaceae bacterium]